MLKQKNQTLERMEREMKGREKKRKRTFEIVNNNMKHLYTTNTFIYLFIHSFAAFVVCMCMSVTRSIPFLVNFYTLSCFFFSKNNRRRAAHIIICTLNFEKQNGNQKKEQRHDKAHQMMTLAYKKTADVRELNVKDKADNRRSEKKGNEPFRNTRWTISENRERINEILKHCNRTHDVTTVFQ